MERAGEKESFDHFYHGLAAQPSANQFKNCFELRGTELHSAHHARSSRSLRSWLRVPARKSCGCASIKSITGQARVDRCAPIQPARPSHMGCASDGATCGRSAGGYVGESMPDRLGASGASASGQGASAGGIMSEHMRTGDGARDTNCRSTGLRTRTFAEPGDMARVGLNLRKTGAPAEVMRTGLVCRTTGWV